MTSLEPIETKTFTESENASFEEIKQSSSTLSRYPTPAVGLTQTLRALNERRISSKISSLTFCHFCECFVQSVVRKTLSGANWLLSAVLAPLCMCCFGFRIKKLKKIEHFCPTCGVRLGVYSKKKSKLA
ncbi:hypothetical protein ROZALSC1DRAFT_24211 [Rozella allomycis CSF55]|uniref:LITAF domain-containing protein n=1 Tax=Rozella allomycis (strain CSF55) TaxID=988480 RepID=A0A4P9YGI1_ROZAC|nr:hypothetical protein ROZALSC1DRAFT_24211 [Rozella allomycis CSF55]